MKIDTWRIEPYFTRGWDGRIIRGYRRIYEGYIRAMIAGNQYESETGKRGDRQALIHGLDDVQIMEVVDRVYEKLDGREIKAPHGEASVKKYVRLVTRRTCYDLLDHWTRKPEDDPRMRQLIEDKNRGIALEGQLKEGTATFSGCAGREGEERKGPLALHGTGGVGKSGVKATDSRFYWNEDPAGIYEARMTRKFEANESTMTLADLARQYGVRSRNIPLLEARLKGLTLKQTADKFGRSEKQVRDAIDRLKATIRQRIQNDKYMGKTWRFKK